MPLADDGVALPVANAAAFVHYLGALLNADAILQHTPALPPTGVMLAPHLLATQVAHQVAALGFVSIGPLVNALSADDERTFELKASTALLG